MSRDPQMFIFDEAVAFTLKWEGDLSDDKDDPGGLTRYGISHKAHPEIDIANLTIEQAKEIYYHSYWLAGSCDDLPKKTAIAHFDACVNCGIARATKFLQKALRVTEDGVFGPVTHKTAIKSDDTELARECIEYRKMFYEILASKHQHLHIFLNGWLNRVRDLEMYVGVNK